jgi:pimeloyl-ACP methyl ester carboxylesterase
MATKYETLGNGDHAVIALHGWFGSAAAWHTLRPHLNGSRFRYVFPDFRGYGARKSEPGTHTIDGAAADVLSTADELGSTGSRWSGTRWAAP